MSEYEWKYCSIGGAIRVNIGSGEDIAHLGELDQKMWTVLSCPADGLEFDRETLDFIDTEKDGRIMVNEVIEAARWLTSVIRDKDLILKGNSTLPLSQINTDCEAGKKLYDSARQILANLGAEKDEITVAEASDSKAIFAGTGFNGDGVITPLSAQDDAQKQVIADCIATIGSTEDRSGEPGITAEQIEAFYTACSEYAAWKELAISNPAVLPYGENTAAALDVCNTLKDKVEDYFTRCRLLAFDKDIAAAVNVEVTDISGISSCPLAHPNESGILPFSGINPAWQAEFDKLKALVIDVDFPDKEGICETEWKDVLGRLDAYTAWLAGKKGEIVEKLSIDRIKAIIDEDGKPALLDLVEKDKALKTESDAIDEVKKLMLYYRDFYRLLNNFVLFKDFYARRPESRAIFELGQLYIDQRCCDLCIRVTDMAQHADMAKLSGMFLIYCKCTSKKLGQTMDIVAVMTDGDTYDLRPGKNGVFYDLKGNDWDAVITKIVDNPVSIRQAFWSPYRKAWEFCVNLINKSAEDKDSKITANLQSKVQTAATTTPDASAAADPSKKQQAFDIAKFAGIFAAIGMALGFIGSFFTSLAKGIAATPAWQLVLILIAIMLLISGPSCFIAWTKLRKRNIGPVLNANGWAINSKVLVNILFGNKLTSVAHYPKLRLEDPYGEKRSSCKGWLVALILLLCCAFAGLYFTGCLRCIGLEHHRKADTEAVVTASESLPAEIADQADTTSVE